MVNTANTANTAPVFLAHLEKYDRAHLRERFLAAEPFHHLVIDDFLCAGPLAEAERQLRALPEHQWHDYHSPDAGVNDGGDMRQQTKKVALANPERMPHLVRRALEELQSPAFLQFLTDVTGVEEPLHVDPSQFGAGVHRVQHGGHLSLHADFNVHRVSGRHRRLNVLLYLNSDWEPSHQGQLELWPRDLSAGCAHALPPIFNRMVLFRITDDAIHGHPHPWRAPTDRLSLALYYYTDDRPEQEKTPAHFGAVWYPDAMDARTTFSGRIDTEALAARTNLRSFT